MTYSDYLQRESPNGEIIYVRLKLLHVSVNIFDSYNSACLIYE